MSLLRDTGALLGLRVLNILKKTVRVVDTAFELVGSQFDAKVMITHENNNHSFG